jgi:hypothetical protein
MEFEMARGPAISIDGGRSVGVPGEELKSIAISDQSTAARFLRSHSVLAEYTWFALIVGGY